MEGGRGEERQRLDFALEFLTRDSFSWIVS